MNHIFSLLVSFSIGVFATVLMYRNKVNYFLLQKPFLEPKVQAAQEEIRMLKEELAQEKMSNKAQERVENSTETISKADHENVCRTLAKEHLLNNELTAELRSLKQKVLVQNTDTNDEGIDYKKEYNSLVVQLRQFEESKKVDRERIKELELREQAEPTEIITSATGTQTPKIQTKEYNYELAYKAMTVVNVHLTSQVNALYAQLENTQKLANPRYCMDRILTNHVYVLQQFSLLHAESLRILATFADPEENIKDFHETTANLLGLLATITQHMPETVRDFRAVALNPKINWTEEQKTKIIASFFTEVAVIKDIIEKLRAPLLQLDRKNACLQKFLDNAIFNDWNQFKDNTLLCSKVNEEVWLTVHTAWFSQIRDLNQPLPWTFSTTLREKKYRLLLSIMDELRHNKRINPVSYNFIDKALMPHFTPNNNPPLVGRVTNKIARGLSSAFEDFDSLTLLALPFVCWSFQLIFHSGIYWYNYGELIILSWRKEYNDN